MKKRTLAAIVSTYEPGTFFEVNLNLIAAEVEHVFLVNDSGNISLAEYLGHIVKSVCNVTLINNEYNIGLAKSLNLATRNAEAAGFNWVIIFDDDTRIRRGSICRLQALAAVHKGMNNIYSLSRINSSNIQIMNPYFVEYKVCITSGSMFSIDLFNKVAGFDESFFIDFLDFDFCLRTLAIGGKVLRTSTGEIEHRVGNPIHIKILFFKIITHNHKPVRYYYHYRSAVLLAKRHYLTQPKYTARVLLGVIQKLTKMLILETRRYEKMKFVAFGILHGILNKVKYNPQV